MLSKNNKSGVKGVCYETRANKWRAYIGFAGEKIRLGYFSSFDEAVLARRSAESLYGKYKGDLILYAKNNGWVSAEDTQAAILLQLIEYAVTYHTTESIKTMWSYQTYAVNNINRGLGKSWRTNGHQLYISEEHGDIKKCFDTALVRGAAVGANDVAVGGAVEGRRTLSCVDDIQDALEAYFGVDLEDAKLFIDYVKGAPMKELTKKYSMYKATVIRHIKSVIEKLK